MISSHVFPLGFRWAILFILALLILAVFAPALKADASLNSDGSVQAATPLWASWYQGFLGNRSRLLQIAALGVGLAMLIMLRR